MQLLTLVCRVMEAVMAAPLSDTHTREEVSGMKIKSTIQGPQRFLQRVSILLESLYSRECTPRTIGLQCDCAQSHHT